ncbi:MAG: HlyC/CorC family transporter [Lachnospiraceae bacterium]|nr:HlyC/CorC family transporter [Lachnospiraceae bacterium]MCI8873149.1 HlyC/CorC family transporter [Lachnospiraceae bacterium]MCI9059884.1 HlyC/CorC family transporter [Lachnospiraceae bacterium]
MDSGDVIQLIIIIILLMLSAFFSSAETALTTSNKIRLRSMAEEGNKRARKVLEITDDSGKMLSAILIGNNIVNLSSASLATTLATKIFGNAGAGIATGILTLLVLIFGEISPKTFATIHSDKISLAYAGVIGLLMKLLTPAIYIINKLALGFLILLRVDASGAQNTMTEDELRTIVDVSHEEGVIETEEREMINNVFDFGDAQAREVMVPRIDMTFADINSTYYELLEIFREDKFTRLPVYEDSTDNVVGIINMKDLLLYEDKDQFSIRNILRKPYYTYEHKNTAELLLEMRKSSINIAIVLDEYGATAGLITLEDLLEEIVGEIRDEYDMDEEDPIQKINELEYMVQGSTNLNDLHDRMNLELVSEDYDSIGGYLIGLLDHLPTVGESITTEENIYFRVEDMEKNRIHKIFIRLPEPSEEEK